VKNGLGLANTILQFKIDKLGDKDFFKQNFDVVWRLQLTSRNLSPDTLSALQMSLPLGPPPQVFKTTLSTLLTKGGFKTHQALRLWEEDTIQRGKDKCEAGELLE
jgi:hypothetical protein